MGPLRPRFVGARVNRIEDPRLLTGTGQYVGDVRAPGMLAMAFVRSPHAAAHISAIDTDVARHMPGVLAVWTSEDCRLAIVHADQGLRQPVLAADMVRYVGEPVVAVVAEDAYRAEDAAEQVFIEYEPVEAVVDAHAAREDRPRRVHADVANQLFERRTATDGFDEAFAAAPRHLQATFTTQRQTAVTLEPRACAAWPDPAGERLTVYVGHQSPHEVRRQLATILGWPEHRVHVVVPEVGGGFGMKAMFYPEYAVVAEAARRLGRPVKWVSDRREAFLSDSQGRDAEHVVEVAFEDSGRIVAVRDQIWGDTGAWPFWNFPGAVGEAMWAADMLPGPYQIRHVALDIAWGGNFYGLVEASSVGVVMDGEHTDRAVEVAQRIRRAVDAAIDVVHPEFPGVRGLTHVEFYGPPTRPDADVKNMVIVPPGGVDRSPCGTGTSAKVAVLVARGQLARGRRFVHESVTGACFAATALDSTRVGPYTGVVVRIRGSAWVYGDSTFVVESGDPLARGFLLP